MEFLLSPSERYDLSRNVCTVWAFALL